MAINRNIDEQVKAFEEKVTATTKDADQFGLQMLKDMQSLSGVLASRELRRLKRKFGKDDPRVKDLQNGLMRIHSNLQNVVKTQGDISINVPETGEGEVLLQGRVKDESGKGATGLTVLMRDGNGNELTADKVHTDASGYFAIKIAPDVMESAKETDWKFSVSRHDGTIIYTHDNAIKLAPDKNLLINTVIERDKLRPAEIGEMLKRRTTVKAKTIKMPKPVDVAMLKEKGYVVLGNKRSKEIHDLDNIQKRCQIDEISASNRAPFKSEENAIRKGYDYCAYCYGPEKSKH